LWVRKIEVEVWFGCLLALLQMVSMFFFSKKERRKGKNFQLAWFTWYYSFTLPFILHNLSFSSSIVGRYSFKGEDLHVRLMIEVDFSLLCCLFGSLIHHSNSWFVLGVFSLGLSF
jgi:hypothetical protein